MAWTEFTPSRTLNKTGLSIKGLNMSDFILLVGLFSFLPPIFHFLLDLGILWVIGVVVIAAFCLQRIRAKYRRHIIRDFIAWMFYRLFKKGVRYEGTANRS